ncbi:hypothetical protein BKA58DRAFT_456295 [Alternaria rosae]|uniref:uncharacterized protein n=1 Tax=Alternaria rosae TaxID=1187941 RepID=UPI001E8CE56A|nr:uncharacterized protein BKA58DRAFT_456295 [Alternaria rosae]KAH6872711.1 hypothetical protein BKA58DRAFT_456295 [Alternaria rosae]
MPTIPTELQARSTAPMNPASAMSQSPSKKRNAEEANPIAENGSDTVQRNDPSLTDPISSSLLPNGQTDVQKTPAKRRRTTQVKRNATPRLATNTPSRALDGTIDKLRAAKTKLYNSAVSDAEDEYIMEAEDDTASEEELSASEEEGDVVEEEDDAVVVAQQLRARATGLKLPHPSHERFQLINAVFNPPPRPAISPWHYGFAAPTLPYYDQSRCPIDWSKVVIDSKVPYECQKAYELLRRANVNVSCQPIRQSLSSQGFTSPRVPLYAELKHNLQGTSEAPVIRRKEPTTDPLFYASEAVQLVVSPPGQNGGVNRFATQEVMDRLPINDQNFLEYSLDNFDRWYTSVFQGRRHSFPRRTYRLEPCNGKGFIHRDNGTPSIAMSDLFETSRLSQMMKTTEVSDMILDEVVQSFKQEIELVNKHEEEKVTMQDCDNTIQSMSFKPGDLSLLWEHTKDNDKIRRVVLESLFEKVDLLQDDVEEQKRHLNRDFVRDWQFYIIRPMVRPYEIVHRFTRGGGILQDFCAQYHNHGDPKSECFHSKPESSKLIPERADEPRIIKVRFGAVDLEIEDRASYAGVTFRFGRLVKDKPKWDWLRIRSIATFVEGPLDPDARRRQWCLEPIYYEPDTVDANGRYPCHLGYQNPDWTHPDLDIEETHVYDEPWDKVIKRGVPAGATKYRENKIPAGKDEHGKMLYKVTKVFFEIEDPCWYPPDDWNADMDSCDLWP